ncbi:hypothetical protein Desti_3238 [Desulfomonile tiedjei DSM 6799]|uniref:Uncharacterized protein n=1 Tax=Desulfomonile tiedjei (strain ATCC 49306 / DSM 6799 / DCB-1) TaxID=706587 RepID=I4C8K6_DESTA|nr:hypothetical protein Desti_3238 [Desulfomonile tiedjei DSM 6799]
MIRGKSQLYLAFLLIQHFKKEKCQIRTAIHFHPESFKKRLLSPFRYIFNESLFADSCTRVASKGLSL